MLTPQRELLNYVLLGLVQGITEFLPISSDGHLVIVGKWLATHGNELTVVVLLHLGSLAALLWSFRRELWGAFRPATPDDPLSGPRLILLLVIGTLPAVILGPPLEHMFSEAFQSVTLAAVGLIVTGLILLSTRWMPLGNQAPSPKSALAMGVAQVVAMLPGISRSATTLAVAFAMGVERVLAARFTFLMAIPAIAGAAVFELRHVSQLSELNLLGVAAGIFTAFVSGLFAIKVLLKLVRRGRFEWFGVYCMAVGLLVLLLR
jgi:undecaprenyl-diphosphatase